MEQITEKRTSLHLIILPAGIKRDNLIIPTGFMSSKDKYSTALEIAINKNSVGYTIVYEDKILTSLRIDVLLNNIKKIVTSSLPGYVIDFYIDYFYKMKDGSNILNSMIVEALLHIDKMRLTNEKYLFPFVYCRSDSVDAIITSLYGKVVKPTIKDDPSLNIVVDQAGYVHDQNRETPKNINDFLRDFYHTDIEDDDDDGKKKKKKKKHVQQFASSRVLRAASNPKKLYNRHGVIICKNKKAIKRDSQTIKEFLEEFIPGNAKWKKDLRKELRKRWMKTFVITKSQLKQLEKNYQKEKRKVSTSRRNTKIVDLTNRVLNVPVDRWSDPSL